LHLLVPRITYKFPCLFLCREPIPNLCDTILPCVRIKESSWKEPQTNVAIQYVWRSFDPTTREAVIYTMGSSSSIGATTLDGFWPATPRVSIYYFFFSSVSPFFLSFTLSFSILFPFFVFFSFLHSLINPLNAELNPICHLLALLRVHHFLHVSRIMVN